MQLPQGGNAPLTGHSVTIDVSSPAPVDASAVLLKSDRKVRTDDDIVFFNHPAQDGVTLQGQRLTIALDKIPAAIDFIAIVASTDQTFDATNTPQATIHTDTRMDFAPAPLTGGETVVVLLELYRRAGTWKIRAVGQGYANGLAGLATDFGVEVEEEAPAARPAISLEKVQAKAPSLINLYKDAGTSLAAKGLTGTRAAVYLVLDRSGSMKGYYKDGTVQHLAEQALGLCAHLDDDGRVPIVFFDTVAHPPIEVSLDDYEGRIAAEHKRLGHLGTTNYTAAMQAVIKHYQASGATAPAFVIFQTDGGPNNKGTAQEVLCESSTLPIFWQFVGFGDNEFRFLKKLDELPVPTKRAVDNAGFFEAGQAPRSLTDTTLYNNLLAEYPCWLTTARTQGIVT